VFALLALGITIPLVTGCPNTCQPSAPLPTITANLTGNTLVVGGNGFSSISQCAGISVLGLPSPNAIVPEGPVNCSGGSFSNATFSFSFTGCTPTTTVPAVVIAVDQGNLATASQTVPFPWGPNCALAGTCGQLGQPVCPGTGCASGLTNENGRCVSCGTEGQPACPDGSCGPLCPDHSCKGSLNPMSYNGQIVCTSLCGFAQGSYCTASMAKAYSCSNNVLLNPEPACEVDKGENRVYTCYGGSRLPQPGADNPDCLCYPNTTSNTCQVNSSTTGTCQGPGSLSGC
jgi:hypothetical protein